MNDTNQNLLQEHTDILSLRDLSPSTIATYTSYMTAFIEWMENFHPEVPLTDIPWPLIRNWMAFLKDVKKLNPKTINVHIAQLHDFYIYILHRDWDPRQVPRIRTIDKLPAVPTKAEVISIIDSIQNPKHKAQIVLLYSSGIRVCELCRLHCGDISLTESMIHISVSKNRCERKAILSEKAVPVLKEYIRSSYRTAKREDWLFPGRKSGKHISAESVRLVFNRQLEDLGLSLKGYNLYSLRHAFGLHLYNAGTDLMSIKEAMGHKSLSSTTVYLTLGIGNGRLVRSPYDIED